LRLTTIPSGPLFTFSFRDFAAKSRLGSRTVTSLLVAAVHLAARRQGAHAAVDRRDRDQRPADQQRHEAFEEVDRGDGEEDQQCHHPGEALAAPPGIPHRAARLDRRVVDRLDRERRPELLLLHRRRVLNLAAAFGDCTGDRLRVAASHPVQIGALEDEEDDDEDRDHAEDQRQRPLWVGVAAVGAERDQGDRGHHRDNADQPEQARALESSTEHRRQPTQLGSA
jgi:hypothetical protein